MSPSSQGGRFYKVVSKTVEILKELFKVAVQVKCFIEFRHQALSSEVLQARDTLAHLITLP